MDCPVCKKTAMIVLELEQVEVDYCTDCGGIWLDSGELELLFENADEAETLIKSFKQAKQTAETPRSCPICDKKMQKILTGSESDSVIIDRCKKGCGLWFDKGELSEILKKGNFDKEQKVIKLLAEIFGQNTPKP